VDSQTWPESPLLLDLDNAQPVVFSILSITAICDVYSKYVYQNGVWIEEALPEKFAERMTNLLIRDGVDMPKFVNVETKRKLNEDNRYRDSLKQVGPAKKVCGG
jgi:hypothetical protein